jgi:hypothetical protein
VRACTCAVGNPADYDGPDQDCPQHGDITAQYGLSAGPALLGRSYSAMGMRVAAVRDLAVSQGIDDRALHLLADTLRAVTASSASDLAARLRTVVAQAVTWQRELSPEPRPDSYGAEHFIRCPRFGDGQARPGGPCVGYYPAGHLHQHDHDVHGIGA